MLAPQVATEAPVHRMGWNMTAQSTSNSRFLRNGVATAALLVALSACASLGLGDEPTANATAASDGKPSLQPAAGTKAVGATPITPVQSAIVAPTDALPGGDLESAIKQAEAARKSGDLQGAAKTLAQLVLYAPDDPRVLAEYGKTLVAQGRSNDALAFLERAIQLQPSDWT